MSISFLLDENLPGQFSHAIHRHSLNSPWPLDAVRVGQPTDLPFGTDDPTILLWAEREGRILVTEDKRTMPDHFAAHLAAGHRIPGILIVREGVTIMALIEFLALVAYASDEIGLSSSRDRQTGRIGRACLD